MPRFKFTADYNHRWPSRAVSHFRADGGPAGDGVYTVKREVVEAAKAAKKGTEVRDRAKATADGAERKAADGLADGDPSPGRDAASRDELEHDGGAGRGDDLPADGSAG